MNQCAKLNAAILRAPGRVEQTGCERETKRENTEKEREREKADGTITKLEEEADGKIGEGGGLIVNGWDSE